MAFDWMHPRIPESFRASWPDKGREAARHEIRERASLLMRLGRSKKEAAARCRQNLEWDWDLSGKPPLLGEIDGLVDEVYRRTLMLDPTSGSAGRS